MKETNYALKFKNLVAQSNVSTEEKEKILNYFQDAEESLIKDIVTTFENDNLAFISFWRQVAAKIVLVDKLLSSAELSSDQKLNVLKKIFKMSDEEFEIFQQTLIKSRKKKTKDLILRREQLDREISQLVKQLARQE